jgi:hypothetical protein
MKSTNLFGIQLSIVCTILVQLFLTGSVSAQYDPFPFRHYQFSYSGGDSLYVIRVDNITQSENEATYYFNPLAKPEASDFVKTGIDYNNIFGQKMIRNQEGNLLFTTTTADTFQLITSAGLKEPWTFHNKTGLTAEISERTTENFLGKSDSVIVFSISNGQEIRLSKKYGFVKTFSFAGKIQGKNHILNLSAIADIRLGKFIFHDTSIRDYQKGDEFIIMKTGVYMGGGEAYYDLNIVGARTDYKDSTLYLLEVLDARLPDVMVTREIKVLHSPFAFINSDSMYVPSFGISLVSGSDNRYFVNTGIGKKEGEKSYSFGLKGTYYWYVNEFHHYWDMRTESHKEGYGMLSESYGIESEHVWISNEMLCFNGQDKSFGNCDSVQAVIMGTRNPEDLQVKISPNPASEVIHVNELKHPVAFRLCDLNGKILSEGEISPSDTAIDIRNLDSGFYLLQLSDLDKIQTVSFFRN